jgi:hypothetical protein
MQAENPHPGRVLVHAENKAKKRHLQIMQAENWHPARFADDILKKQVEKNTITTATAMHLKRMNHHLSFT